MIVDLTAHLRRRAWTLGAVVLAVLVLALTGPRPADTGDGGALAGVIGDGCPVVDGESFRWIWPARVTDSGPMEWHPAVFLARVDAT